MTDRDLKAVLLNAMESYFGSDDKRIDHACRVTDYAEKLWEKEGGDFAIVIAAAVLHDIGIHEAERKYNSASGKHQQIEGPPIARDILNRLGVEPSHIDEICQIIAYHHSIGPMRDNPNFNILYDADWLVNLPDEYDTGDRSNLRSIIDKVFLTESGRKVAEDIYLS